MIKKLFIFFIFVFLTNCSPPGTALLGPTFTGFKTGSIYQTSIAYGSGKVVNTVKNSFNDEFFNSNKFVFLGNKKQQKEMKDILYSPPKLIIALKTHKIEISEVQDEEPLP